MLTLKAKLDPVLGDREGLKANPARLGGRLAEVWAFFFGIVPVRPVSIIHWGTGMEREDYADGIQYDLIVHARNLPPSLLVIHSRPE
jgi:hypothetical protein